MVATVLPGRAQADGFLAHYAARLDAVELNNTYYQSPKPRQDRLWLAATPATFRFAVKAQRGGSFRAMSGDPGESVAWLTDPYRRFGERLGTVLLYVPGRRIDHGRLVAALAAWPRDIPLTMEFPDPTWHVDETFEALAAAGAALCATEQPDDEDAADDPADRTAPVPAAPTPRLLGGGARCVGRTGSSRSSPPGTTRTSSSATTRSGVARNSRRALRSRRRAAPLTDQPREPSAGPKTTRSSRRSVMSWNLCGTVAATKTIEPGLMSRVVSPTVTRARPVTT